MDTIRLYVGYDPREAVGWHTFAQSVIDSREQVSITTLQGEQRDGTNAFTYERFKIPFYCGFEGWAIWADGSDMLLRGKLSELWAMRNPHMAVQVVQHDYETKHPRKYVGTPMEAANGSYPRKNWSSVVIFNCGSFLNRHLTPELVNTAPGSYLHRFEWLAEDRIGALPLEWNWLDEYGPNDQAKLYHWTTGIPHFEHYRNAPHADEWRKSSQKV